MRILLKGSFLQKCSDQISKEKLGESIKDHNLVKLLRLIPEIEINSNEISVLDTLTQAIVWMGRYPVPVWSKHFQNVPPNVENEAEVVKGLYNKLKDQI